MVYRRGTGKGAGAAPLGAGSPPRGGEERQRSRGPHGLPGGTPGAQAEKRQRHGGGGPGHLAVVSLGPGAPDYLAPRARAALAAARVVVGYQTYVDLIAPLLTHQEVVATGMKAEVKRCQAALDLGLAGDTVALVSSGDAGIYGMAGLILEMCAARELKVGPPGAPFEVDLYLEVIPGIPALAAGAALLGAPLMHDFAAISLSDLLTPWEVIERRVSAGRGGRFCRRPLQSQE